MEKNLEKNKNNKKKQGKKMYKEKGTILKGQEEKK